MDWSPMSQRSSSTDCSSKAALGAETRGAGPGVSYNSQMDDVSINTMTTMDEARTTVSSVNDASAKFEVDQSLLPDTSLNKHRRTVVIERAGLHESFGFALQSYVFKRKSSEGAERITYVDYVREGSPASRAGMQRGDVVVAVNGVVVVGTPHSSLVRNMQQQVSMRVVLVFQNVVKIIELSARTLKLQHLLAEREFALEKAKKEEERLLKLAVDRARRKQHSSLCIDDDDDVPDLPFSTPHSRMRTPSHPSLPSLPSRSSIDSTGHSHSTLPSLGTASKTCSGSSIVSACSMSRSRGTNRVASASPAGRLRFSRKTSQPSLDKGQKVALTHLIRVDSQANFGPEMTRL